MGIGADFFKKDLLRYFFLAGLLFSLLSFFEIYRYILEPLRLHHAAEYFLPNWFYEFSMYYQAKFPNQKDRYVIMIISAQVIGFLFGVVMFIFFGKRMASDLKKNELKFIEKHSEDYWKIIKFVAPFFAIGCLYFLINVPDIDVDIPVSNRSFRTAGFLTYALHFSYFSIFTAGILRLFKRK